MNLAQVQVFLVLAEELHFGRTAERLSVTQPRVSRVVATLEDQVGGALFERHSRRVALTPLGIRFYDEIRPAYAQLHAAFANARAAALENAGRLLVGFTVTSGGEPFNRLLNTFETRYPGCEVELREVECYDVYGPLRRGEIDVLIFWPALDESDLTAGPAIDDQDRVLLMSVTDPLATRDSVSIEDLGGRDVISVKPTFPQAFMDRLVPPATPAGVPIRRTHPIETFGEIATLVARGLIIHPSVTGCAVLMDRPDIASKPIHDLPPLPLGLIWVTAHQNARIHALAETATDLPPTRPLPDR